MSKKTTRNHARTCTKVVCATSFGALLVWFLGCSCVGRLGTMGGSIVPRRTRGLAGEAKILDRACGALEVGGVMAWAAVEAYCLSPIGVQWGARACPRSGLLRKRVSSSTFKPGQKTRLLMPIFQQFRQGTCPFVLFFLMATIIVSPDMLPSQQLCSVSDAPSQVNYFPLCSRQTQATSARRAPPSRAGFGCQTWRILEGSAPPTTWRTT